MSWDANEGMNENEQLRYMVIENLRLRGALAYIARPTMGLPSGADPAEFARDHATEANVRIALATCIQMAQDALAPAEEQEHGST